VPFEAVLGGRSVDRLAVVELDARPELDGHRLAVGRGLVAERKLRYDVRLLVDVEQLVAQRGEDDACGVEARRGGIEPVGIIAEADAQMALGEGAAGAQAESQGQGKDAGSLSHGVSCALDGCTRHAIRLFYAAEA